MTQMYDVRDFPPPDGVRDRFRWARFSNPRYLLIGLTLFLVTLVVMPQPHRPTQALAAQLAADTARTAWEVTQRLATTTAHAVR